MLPETITLYHGTTEELAASLLSRGWEPGSGMQGANLGRTGLLYVTTESENALWFAEQKGGDAIVEVTVSLAGLIVDPADGVGETVEEEMAVAAKLG